jgi:hypothetical protein
MQTALHEAVLSKSGRLDLNQRPLAPSRCPGERRGQATYDGPRTERNLRGDVHGDGRRDPPVRLDPQACLFWWLLTRERDYAFAQPSLTAKKLRPLEIRAGARTLERAPTRTFATPQRMRAAERELVQQAEVAYRRSVRDWHATQARRKGAGATPGRASRGPSSGQAARQVQAPGPAL